MQEDGKGGGEGGRDVKEPQSLTQILKYQMSWCSLPWAWPLAVVFALWQRPQIALTSGHYAGGQWTQAQSHDGRSRFSRWQGLPRRHDWTKSLCYRPGLSLTCHSGGYVTISLGLLVCQYSGDWKSLEYFSERSWYFPSNMKSVH
jgi:hypothetical protein